MPRRSSGSGLAIIAGSSLLLLIGVVARWRAADEPPPAPSRTPPAAAPTVASPDPEASADASAADAAPRAPHPPQDRAAPQEDPLANDPVSHGTWEALDLEAIRAEMPDNLYWKMAVPTKDPELLQWREEERARWNVEYGKVLSNTATAEEIDAYYAGRKRLSDDYLEFVVHVLSNYGGAIPREGVAMLKLAGELHAARLEEMPRQQAEAHARREAHDAARRAWLEEQKAFQDGETGTP